MHTIDFWDVDDTHHVLPVFAAGKAICPTAFDSILCQVCYFLIIIIIITTSISLFIIFL